MKYFSSLLVFIILNTGVSSAQSFHDLGLGFNNGVYGLCYDSDDSILYAGGVYWSFGNGDGVYKIAQWNGLQWDSLGSGVNDGGYVRTIQKYNGNIFVGGTFSQIGGVVSKGLATWDGIDWSFFGNFSHTGSSGYVLDLYKYGSDLYIGGGFDSINGVPAFGLARFDGINIFIYPTIGPWFTAITSMAFYNGELYVGGNFDPGGGMNDIAKFNGSNWVSVGGGFSGGATIVDDMIVFNGELYVSGHFLTSYGDPGNLIAKWNGSTWSSLGSGLVGGNCFDLHIFNNELYVGGSIMNAGGIPVTNIAKWNGFNWSSTGSNIDAAVICFESINDNLFLGGGFLTINGDTMNRISRYNLATGFEEMNEKLNLEIFPNPAKEYISISFPKPINTPVEVVISNIKGQEIIRRIFEIDNGIIKIKLNKSITSGIFTCQIISTTNVFTKTFVVEK